MTRLLSLDQSSKTTGYAIFEDNKLIHYGHFTCNQEDLGDRLFEIRKNVHQLIYKYNINKVIMEDIQLQEGVGNNVQTFKILAEVFGIIYELLTELDIEVDAVLATVWKRAIGIKSNRRQEQKAEAQKYVTEVLNVIPTEDESDAICIGCYQLNIKPKQIEVFDWTN